MGRGRLRTIFGFPEGMVKLIFQYMARPPPFISSQKAEKGGRLDLCWCTPGVSGDGRRIAIAFTASLEVRSLATGRLIWSISDDGLTAAAMAVSYSGRWVACGRRDGRVQVMR